MKSAIYYNPGEVRLGDFPVEDLGQGDIRLRVELCGVCGSDIKTYLRGTHYMIPPAVLGHEVVGTVTESRNAKWQKGDRVAVAHYMPCGSCEYCMAGKGTLCPELFDRRISPGGFAEYMRVPRDLAERGTFKVADDFDPYAAVLAEPLACCIHGARMVGIPEGARVLVIGDGPMGLLHVQAVRAFGASQVLLSGMTPHRLEVGAHYANHVIDASKGNVQEEVRRLTGGLGPDVIIVAVAAVEVAKQATEMVRSGGSVLLFGGFPSESKLTIDPNRVHYDEVRIIGSAGSLPHDMALALRLLQTGQVKKDHLFTHRYSLDQVPLALERGTRQEGVKAVVDPWAPAGTAELIK